VLVADDHIVTRHGLSMLCRNVEGVEVVVEAADGYEAIRLVEELQPDVVLMDINMPRCDGIEATQQIHRDHPDVGVIILTAYDEEDETILRAMRAGVVGCLSKSAPLHDICSAVKTVANGGAHFDPVQACVLLRKFFCYADRTKVGPPVYDLLTLSELRILCEMSTGMTGPQIADKLGIRPRTVSAHMSNIYRKLHVNNRVDAMRYAQRAYPASMLPEAG
jgi:DNA-binding NarL/FixJ family response regulator